MLKSTNGSTENKPNLPAVEAEAQKAENNKPVRIRDGGFFISCAALLRAKMVLKLFCAANMLLKFLPACF
jgi:hypothetical protein